MAHESSVEDTIALLEQFAIAPRGTVVGVTESEIVRLEGDLGVTLPESYRRFLGLAGGGLGRFLDGTDFAAAELVDMRRSAERLLRDNGASFKLAKRDIVIAMHQGYEFLYLAAGGTVWRYVEPRQEPEIAFPSFEEWFATAARDEVALATAPRP